MTTVDLAVLDRVIADLQMVRDRLAGEPLTSEGPEADDDAPCNLIELSLAAQHIGLQVEGKPR
ncbi:hypothetical protein [Rhizobium etli]|uniref:Uncharacterized protein n=1 Tax=Rhizobium etli TaxID=29449 RepID=A0A7W6ZE68_RHIET|nr:hypothetical protein [Rhizobium etli]MBB4478444.1 hypothetical protein [Rhizobium etli]MBB4534276.1 hypothetical protein [Rhizobium etli]